MLFVTFFEDPELKGSLTWPDGTYSLPGTVNGCPASDTSWAVGTRRHDSTLSGRSNCWEPENIHLELAIKEQQTMEYSFCTKTVSQSASSQRKWQTGSYCIYQYSELCPEGKIFHLDLN